MHRLNSQWVTSFFERLAKADHRCLMLDYDGTLAPFTTDRENAEPYPGVRDAVQRIAAAGGTSLAVVSGRAVREVQSLLGLQDGIEYWGSHGAEQLGAEGGYSSYELSEAQARGVAEALAFLKTLVPPENIEHKPFSVALHWRGLPESESTQLKTAVQPRWQELAAESSLSVHPFNGGLELRPGDATKAGAVKRITSKAPPGSLAAYLGDDLTDEDAFAALPPGGLGVLVGDSPRRSRAEVFIRRFDEVLEFLERWSTNCR